MEGEQPHLGDLLTMVINHLLTGMILQVIIPLIFGGGGVCVCIGIGGVPLDSHDVYKMHLL